MTEDQLSCQIVKAVRNKHPETRGRFFHISNERNNKTQAYVAKAIGIFPGVADFIYLYEFTGGHGFIGFTALEVKVPNSRHEVSHIEQQVEWGELVESLGGNWRLITSEEEAVNCVEGNLKGFTTQEVRKLLQGYKLKTIIIPKWQKEY